MNAIKKLLHTLLISFSLALPATPTHAALFGIGENLNGLPPIVLEADYDYYGETGTLSKLRGKHLRPPYSLPVSTVAIVDDLNAELEKRGKTLAPQVAITDRLKWGRFEIFSVLKPLPNGKKISKPTPVLCTSKYDCKVDYAFEDRLSKETRAMLSWTRYYLMKNHRSKQLSNQQAARVTGEYRLLSLYDRREATTAAINFWLNVKPYTQRNSISLETPATHEASEVNTVIRFVTALKALPEEELNDQSFAFNQVMQNELQSLFAGQYTYPYTVMKPTGSPRREYSREDLSAVDLAKELRNWESLQPLAYINGTDIRYLVFSINNKVDNLHILPVSCSKQQCEKLHWEQLRSTELRLLNHPLIITQLADYLGNT